jgi:hypothetical protein
MKEFRFDKKYALNNVIIYTSVICSLDTIFLYYIIVGTDFKYNVSIWTFVPILFLIICFFITYILPTYIFWTQYKFEKDILISFDENTGQYIYKKEHKCISFNTTDIKYFSPAKGRLPYSYSNNLSSV